MTFHRDELGQSIVELALTLPIMVFVLVGGADLARAYAVQLAVQNGARAGAEAAAIDFSPSESLAILRSRDEMQRTPGMDYLAPTVTATFRRTDGVTLCPGTPTIAEPCFVTVRVVHTFTTVIPWPIIPNTFTFDRFTTMRTIVGP